MIHYRVNPHQQQMERGSTVVRDPLLREHVRLIRGGTDESANMRRFIHICYIRNLGKTSIPPGELNNLNNLGI